MINSPLIIGAYVLAAFISYFAGNDIQHLKQEDRAIKACIFNPAYEGANAVDSRQLFLQCIDDYKVSSK